MAGAGLGSRPAASMELSGELCTSQVIAKLEPDLSSTIVWMRWAEPDQRNALLVVHHVHLVVFAARRGATPTVMFEGRIDVVCDLHPTALGTHQLLDPLASRAVEIVRVHERNRA